MCFNFVKIMFSFIGDVAQMVERSLCMREVQGSMPCISTLSLFDNIFFYCKFIMPEKEIIKFLKKQNQNENKKGNEYVFDIQKEIWIKVFIKKEKK